MKLFARETQKPVTERRASPRTRVDCMVLILNPSGNVPGRLFDISEHGARITAEKPPGKGCAVILDWPYGEAYGFITWSKPGMCGVQFEAPIPLKMLEKTIEEAPSGPRLVHNADSGAGPSVPDGSKPNNGGKPMLFC
ncbi:PilZ domain-containing protein [Aurantiacibacter sp. MUD61]|uniref:PilZ domain-containing protein n=1 Tax=Aurantiacibacter sp. MUD61 TaxID=3009083 RepID=UPI0022F07C45|nr:PilZ domain-containing protein [Aurantiacibacter sp. MUD61]